MKRQQLIEQIQSELAIVKKYRINKIPRWKEVGIILDEVDYKAASSHAELTNAHRNDTAIKLYKQFLERLHALDNQ